MKILRTVKYAPIIGALHDLLARYHDPHLQHPTTNMHNPFVKISLWDKGMSLAEYFRRTFHLAVSPNMAISELGRTLWWWP
jgi:hypothetical protein